MNLRSPEQTFDLAVTVWVRTDEDVDLDEEVDESTPVVDRMKRLQLKPPREVPIYSDIVFRGLQLKDKNVYATISRRPFLTVNDLRGSVVLIPSSPSPLDNIIEYSSWIPSFINKYPARSWPFPLGSTDVRNRTLADEAIDSFGVTVPLLQFHNTPKKCQDTEDDVYLEEKEGEPVPSTTEFRSPLTHHPYIVTRTQILVVDETMPLDRKAYLQKHRWVKQVSCSQQRTLFPSIHDCDRTYNDVGHIETSMTLRTRHEDTFDLVYSPYISASRSSGPKDLLHVPVHRQVCSTLEDRIQAAAGDKDSIDVTWNLAFSGRSHVKYAFGAGIDSNRAGVRYDMELSEHHQILAQDDIELESGVYGFRYHENSHPRRRYLLLGLRVKLATAILILDGVYWWSRKTTVSISTFGTLLLAGSKMISIMAPDIAMALLHNEGAFDWLTTLLSMACLLFPAVFMIKTVLHITFLYPNTTRRKWMPRRTLLTHAERASQMLENRMSYWVKGTIIAILFAVYYAVAPHMHPIIPAILPDAHADDYAHSWLIDGWPYFSFPMATGGMIFQLLLNSQTGAFAGSYKAHAVCSFVLPLLNILEYIPGVIGPYGARPRLVAHEVIDLALAAVSAWQSFTLPRVDQDTPPMTSHTE
ncbi:hypothetical protein H0H92_015574 [Tricholoma furcatifolium]|nr:hypothetical protein H0H92_015574 [Tricholoma furcatifolium]